MNQQAVLSAIIAFSLWGLFPIYWKFFSVLPAFNLFAHRLFWSFLTLWGYTLIKKNHKTILQMFLSPYRWWLILSAILISSNWLIYVKAVSDNKIVEASMGYFLNPLINILIGRLFLKEQMRPAQIPAVFFAFFGVCIMIYQSGLTAIPWVALSLSFTFALYGLIRKLVPVKSMDGLTFETTVVFFPLVIYLFLKNQNIFYDFQQLTLTQSFILQLSGVITCLPLLLFAYAARHLPLQVLGFTQYLSPSFKFLCGWLIFQETITTDKWWAFIFIWLGLIIYYLEMIYHKQQIKD